MKRFPASLNLVTAGFERLAGALEGSMPASAAEELNSTGLAQIPFDS